MVTAFRMLCTWAAGMCAGARPPQRTLLRRGLSTRFRRKASMCRPSMASGSATSTVTDVSTSCRRMAGVEQPASLAENVPWKFYPDELGRWPRAGGSVGGAEMFVYDVNGDGLNDVVTSLEAHGWGIAWFEQKRDSAGAITFVRHMIIDNFSTKNAGNVAFSEPHGAALADVDGDGIPDLIIGKRVFSHQESFTDPDPLGPGVLYWFRAVRNSKRRRWRGIYTRADPQSLRGWLDRAGYRPEQGRCCGHRHLYQPRHLRLLGQDTQEVEMRNGVKPCFPNSLRCFTISNTAGRQIHASRSSPHWRHCRD